MRAYEDAEAPQIETNTEPNSVLEAHRNLECVGAKRCTLSLKPWTLPKDSYVSSSLLGLLCFSREGCLFILPPKKNFMGVSV